MSRNFDSSPGRSRLWASGWILASLLTNIGCNHLWPNVSRPGTAPAQQRRATLHDPYPDPDLAPEIVGGRPREYQVPYHEAVKSRAFVDRFQ